MISNIAIISGYFNPLHGGHIDYLKGAFEYGEKVIVIINNDKQQALKKGKVIMSEDERLKVVSALAGVTYTTISIDQDSSVCATLRELRRSFPDDELVFCNGGDRTSDNIPEVPVCKKLNIKMEFGVGGKKTNSSSEINQKIGAE